ncbi:MAG: T9SS type A sorting domain-containing protein [Bacteroidales bacterium]|nr:T9SS type A sorting domain-containing protein [Bacteroidales bacterium]
MKNLLLLLIASFFVFPFVSRSQENPSFNLDNIHNKNTQEILAIYVPYTLKNEAYKPFKFAKDLNQTKNTNEIKQALDSMDIIDDGLVYQKYKYTYNTKGQCIIIDLFLPNESNEMVNYRKIIYSYWPDGQIKKFQVETWREDLYDWVSSLRIEYTYTSGLLTESRVFSWDVELSEWDINSKDIYAYDEEKHLILITTKIDDSGSWENHQKEVYSYNDDSYPYLWIGSKWLEEAWMPSDKREQFFDENGHLDLTIDSDWIEETELWQEHQKSTYTYNDDNQRIMALYTVFDTEVLQWRNLNKDEYTKDDYDNRTMEIDYIWENDSWLQISKEEWVFDYAYPANIILFPKALGASHSHMLTKKNSFHWNDNIWYPWTNDIYYYSSREVNDIEEHSKSNVKVYPNPNNGVFKLEIGRSDKPSTISIISFNGQIILQEEISDSSTQINRSYDLSAYAKGVYLLRVSNSSESSSFKITVY